MAKLKIAMCHLEIFCIFTWKTSKFSFLGKLIFEVPTCMTQPKVWSSIRKVSFVTKVLDLQHV